MEGICRGTEGLEGKQHKIPDPVSSSNTMCRCVPVILLYMLGTPL